MSVHHRDRPAGSRARRRARGAGRLVATAAAAWSALAACPAARAADPAAFDGVVLVAPAIAVADPADADDCDWTTATPKRLVDESKGRVRIEGSGAPVGNVRRLTLVEQTMHVVGGGPWTGPKWIVLNGTLTESGRTVGTFEARRQTIRGSLGSCATARELGEEIADDIVEWLDHPTMDAKLGDAK